MRFTPCACGMQYLVRLDRQPWMRLIPTRRHYFCAKCKNRQLLPRRAFVSWWLPGPPPSSSLPAPDTRAPRAQARANR